MSGTVRVSGRGGLRAHLAASHKPEAECSRDPDAQLERGGWTRTTSKRVHLFGGAAEVEWKYKCPTCRAVALVVVD